MRTIPLTRGYVALVDDEDYERVAARNWHADVREWTVYAKTGGSGRGASKIYLHRFLLGVTEPEILVDHEDGDGLNCQRYNLRKADDANNNWNRGKGKRRRTSVYKGVSKHSNPKFWQVKIHVRGRDVYLGIHTNEIKAAQVYDAAAREHFGEFAKLNFPDAEAVEA
jgi:hypothetical protein